MKKTLNTILLRLALYLVFVLFAISCGSESDGTPQQPEEEESSIEDTPPVVFTTIGDVPYDERERNELIALISDHNVKSESEFVVHIGDIKSGADSCNEEAYSDVSDILKEFNTPTFMILGDNEFNDCTDPRQGLQFWNQYFLNFNENWQFGRNVRYQQDRPENFAWTENEVLFIGINLVRSNIQAEQEWVGRLVQDAQWVAELLEEYKEDMKATVVFSHPNILNPNILNYDSSDYEVFTDTFRASATQYDQPILLIHGSGHSWIEDRPWPEQNILRVQINGGSEAVQVTVDTSKENPFNFDTRFLE